MTTGPGGAELTVAGDETPFTEIEIGYEAAGIFANCCGTVKLIWNSPTATSAAKSAGNVTVPMVTVTPLTPVCVTSTPAGAVVRAVAKSWITSPGLALRNAEPADGSPIYLLSLAKTPPA